MTAFKETNVRILECAWDALENTRQALRRSRDAMVRDLLLRHVESQQSCSPDDRLTHISTVIRHPAPPLGQGFPLPGKVLRLRLPAGLAEEARSVALLLPGQPLHRGHRDYQARLLADAVTTAIARSASFTDDVLSGLRPVLRQRAALGLWRLAVAATSTHSEREVYLAAAEHDDEYAGVSRAGRVAETLRSHGVAWHDRWRYEMAAHLARKFLSTDSADANQQMLYEQGEEWLEHRDDLEYALPSNHLIKGFSAPRYWSLEGRGSAAVWRAQRQVGLKEIADDLVHDRRTESSDVEPPGWPAKAPEEWQVLAARIATGPWLSRAADGQVLTFEVDGELIYWPVVRTSAADPSTSSAVPGLADVVGVFGDLPVIEVAERILLQLDSDHDEDWRLGSIEVPVHKAFAFGLIDAATRNELIVENRAATLEYMQQVIKGAPVDDRELGQQLRDVMNSPAEFRKIAMLFGADFSAPRALWRWPAESIAGEVQRGRAPQALRWLAAWVLRRSAFALEQSMQKAWHSGFDRFDHR
ncbi:hypothetical protein E1263_20860 [Kribbella antibiotica]|uniref:Uncharacterized protein n=1 Tax=Kribbella antibiotica TaxID=190195 RepID=A0A4R4ZIQ7_9ACTN|nr:hypothetical protein [Kribbella antibiotica]TDD58010.1 hypothetical protein E1263_20860 [Kribbella antibiotica]